MEMTARTAKNAQMVKMISAVCSTADLAFLLPIIEFIKISIPQAACRRLPFIKGYPTCGYAHNTGKCRSDIAGIFPNEASYVRLVTTYLMEYAVDWSVSRAYLSQDSIEATLFIAA